MTFNFVLLEVKGLPWRLRQERIRLQCCKPGFDPGVGKIPWRMEQVHRPVFLPGEFHGQRSLAGYSAWSHKESDVTDDFHFHFQGGKRFKVSSYDWPILGNNKPRTAWCLHSYCLLISAALSKPS